MNSSKRRRSKRGKSTNKNGNKAVPESVKTVLNLEELLDLIVALVLTYTPDLNDACTKNIRSLRLVSKAWLSSVSRVLYKNGLPLIQFIINHSNFIATNKHNVKALNNFVRSYCSAFAANKRNAPTYSLDIDTRFFQNRKFGILRSCFLYCGKGLVELEIKLLKEIRLSSKTPKFTLPNLKKLIIFERDSESEEALANTGNLLKHFLEASGCLEELTLETSVGLSTLGFRNFLLPSKLTKLDISVFDLEDVEILSKNLLPKLTELELTFREGLVLHSSVFTMLNNWRKSMRKLSLDLDGGLDMPQVNLHFPVMKKLNDFEFCLEPDFELNQTGGSLELYFPSLTKLRLALSQSSFKKWCVNSVFRLVENLDICLYEEGECIPIDLQSIQLTCMTFPNVTALHIQILGRETSVLHFIFMEMVLLSKLDLLVVGIGSIRSSIFWDALLIGTTLEVARKLKRNLYNPDFAEIVENTNTPSIMRLTNLSALSLETYGDVLEPGGQLISEVSFIHAFLKMKKLGKLHLRGRFELSRKMQESLKPKLGAFFVLT